MIELSQDSSSVFYGKVDTDKIAATGYSLGGMGAMQVAQNEEVATTFILASQGNSGGLHGPLGGMFAESDQYFDWEEAIVPMIANSSQPAFAARLAGRTPLELENRAIKTAQLEKKAKLIVS